MKDNKLLIYVGFFLINTAHWFGRSEPVVEWLAIILLAMGVFCIIYKEEFQVQKPKGHEGIH